MRSKKNGGAMLITVLSQPLWSSVNDYISREDYSMKFCNVNDAIVTTLGLGALIGSQASFSLDPSTSVRLELSRLFT